METKLQGKLMYDILNGGNMAAASLANHTSIVALRMLVNSEEASKTGMKCCAASFIGPKDLEISKKDLKDIENKVYNRMIMCLHPFMYQNINIIPKREFFKLTIDTKNALENKEEINGIDKNGKANETLIYSIEVENPFFNNEIGFKDLDKYFDCYINNNRIKNISIKTIYRNQIGFIEMGVIDEIRNSVLINIGHTVDLLMDKGNDCTKHEEKFRVACSANINDHGMIDFNNISSVATGFVKSELRNGLEMTLNNICSYRMEDDAEFKASIKINKVDVYPFEPRNVFFGYVVSVLVDYTVCVERK